MFATPHTPSRSHTRVIKPDSPSGHGIIAVVFAGVSPQMPCSAHVRRSDPHSPRACLPHVLVASLHVPPSAHSREIWPTKPAAHGCTTTSPSYAASHAPSAAQMRLGPMPHPCSVPLRHSVSTTSPHAPVTSQKRVRSPKKPAPHPIAAFVSAPVSGQSPSATHVICTAPHPPVASLPHWVRSTAPHTPSAPHTRVMVPVNPGTQGAVTSVSEGLRAHSPTASQ